MLTNRAAHKDDKSPFIAVYFWQSWTEWFHRSYNWWNFTVVGISFEDNTKMSGYFDLTIGLIGFNVIIGLRVHKETEIKNTIMAEYRKAVEDGTNGIDGGAEDEVAGYPC